MFYGGKYLKVKGQKGARTEFCARLIRNKKEDLLLKVKFLIVIK